MQKVASQYDADFVAWTEEQAGTLRELGRAGTNLPLDWDNLAEEVESWGISQRTELASRVATIVEHLLKLECSSARDPRRGWAETILRERSNIQELLEKSPSLTAAIPDIVARQNQRVGRLICRTLELYDEATPGLIAKVEATRYDAGQVLGDWLPADIAVDTKS